MKVSLIILTGVVLSSCFHKHYTTSGSLTQEKRTCLPYSSVISEGSIDIFVTQDTSYQILVEAGSNMINYIETDVVNGQLIVRQIESHVLNEKPMRVFLSVDSLDYIETNGSGDFDADHLNASIIDIQSNGSGNIDINIDATTINASIVGSGNYNLLGNCTTLNGYIHGSGNLYGRYLYTNNCNITIEGSGDATVNVSDNLNASIYGSGNVIYYGNPTNVTSQIQGSGQLIQK